MAPCWGARVAQSVEPLTLAQVVSSSPRIGFSVVSVEPASYPLSPLSLFAPLPQINKQFLKMDPCQLHNDPRHRCKLVTLGT